MKKIITYMCGVFAFTALTSCDKADYSNIVPEEYASVLLFKEFGENPIDLYDTGEDGEYSFTIFKSGKTPEIETEVGIRVMDEVSLNFYSELIGRKYKLLPEGSYQLSETNFHFPSNLRYKKGSVTLNPTKVKTALEANTDGSTYVLPIELFKLRDKDSINSEKKLLVIRPKVVVPTLSYRAENASIDIAKTEANGTYEFYLTLPFDSPWDFDATIAVDETATAPDGYTKISTNAVQLPNGGKVSFQKGSRRSSSIQISVANTGEFVGPKFVLPVKVQSTTKQGIAYPSVPFNLFVGFNKIPLVASMLSTNEQEQSEGPIANAVDGNPNTYFHSRWQKNGGATSHNHYIQVQLQEPVSKVVFNHKTRHNGNAGSNIKHYKVLVSFDGNTWTDAHSHEEEGLPTGKEQDYFSPVIQHATPFTHIRIEVIKNKENKKFFTIAELNLWAK